MNYFWTIMITFIVTTYLIVNIIESECEWKGKFIRHDVAWIMPTISINCSPRTPAS